MKRSLRVTLLTILLSLTLLTVGVLGFSTYANTKDTAQDLSGQILEQTSRRIDHEIEDIARTAFHQSDIYKHLLHTGLLKVDDLTSLAAYSYQMVDLIQEVSGFFYVRESDGKALYISQSPVSNRITMRIIEREEDGRGWRMRIMSPRDFLTRDFREPHGPASSIAALAGHPAAPLAAAAAVGPWITDPVTTTRTISLDMRHRPGYQTAKKAGKPTWTNTYPFYNEQGELSYPGLSYVTPVHNPDGSLSGVLGVSFHVYALCDLLGHLSVSDGGYAFVVEQRDDGSRRLIAHPDRTVVLKEQPSRDDDVRAELLPLDRLADGRVAALVGQIPAPADLDAMRNMRRARFRHDGQGWLGGYRSPDLPGGAPPWLVCIVLPEDDVLAGAKRNTQISLWVALVVLLLAVLLSLWTSAQVAKPLEALARDAEAVGRLELDARPVGHSMVLEVDRLACAAEDMKASLRSFRKYVPAGLVQKLMQSGREATLGGEERRLTIAFSDIADFTTIAEGLAPGELVEHLGEYLRAMSGEVLATGGTVDKFIGDAVMAFWGAPAALADHALAACVAAVRSQQALERLRPQWQAQGKPAFHARIGIHTGEVIVGNIGHEARFNYTVIGDAVNLASRLEGLNKFYGTSILISEDTWREARDGIVVRPVDWVSVKGRSEAVLVYELLGLKGEVAAETEELATVFGEALERYRSQCWDEAAGLFEQVLARRPDDGPARELLCRCRAYRDAPPGPGWDCVHRMHEK